MNLKNRNFTCKSAFIFLTLLSTQVSAGVRSMGQETTVDNGPYLQVSVQCTTQKSSIFLRKHKKGKEWCDQKLGVVCSTRKMAAAQKICGRQYLSALNKDSMKNMPAQVISKRSTAVGASNPKKMAKGSVEKSLRNTASLRQEKFDIEQKLIEIEALKLDLRRREIDLRKLQVSEGLSANELVLADK